MNAEVAYKKVFGRPESLKPNHTHYCPGCGHSIAHRLVAECLDEMGLREKTIGVPPVGCAVLAYNYFNFDMVDSLFTLFGKDMTLTGRVDLWDILLLETKKNLLHGCGFGGFWVAGSPIIDSIYTQFLVSHLYI